MKQFFIISSTSFVFSVSLWIIWSFFTLQAGLTPTWLGSLIYLPHAARVLCIVYFGWKAIPGLYLAELWGPFFVAEDIYNFAMWIPSAISVLAVPFALFTLESFGFPLGKTKASPLNKRNYKHIGLITMISAFFNALMVNLYLTVMQQNFDSFDADIVQVLRFFIGDMLGTLLVFASLAILFRPLFIPKR